MLFSEIVLNDINFEILKKALIYIKINLIDCDNNTHLTVDSLIDINDIINVRIISLGEKLIINHLLMVKCIWKKDLIADKLHELIDQLNEGNINQNQKEIKRKRKH